MPAPLNVKQLLAKSAKSEFEVEVEGEKSIIAFEYYPHKYNLDIHLKLSSGSEGDFEPLLQILASLLCKWNLVDDDGKMIPITFDNLKAYLSVPMILKMVEAVVGSVVPSGNSTPSSAG